MPHGKVKWYDPEKGFGFITQDEGEDVYVRASVLPDDVTELKPGQRVDMDIAAGRRGPQASVNNAARQHTVIPQTNFTA